MKRDGVRLLRVALFGILVVFFLIKASFAYNLLEPDVLKQWLEAGKKVIIVDIQPHDEFVKHHFKGSIETNAFPANNDELKKRIDKALPIINKSTDPVVIVCPRGRSGAQNTYDYLKSKGVPESRLYILKGGMANWPYPELLEKGK
ncbi:MAG: rhodanese-like domain-containing protein [Caldimicrobium sp.]